MAGTLNDFRALHRLFAKIFCGAHAFPVAILRRRCYGVVKPGKPTSGGEMTQSIERRASRRFTMTLPLTVRTGGSDNTERQGQTRDVSFRGLYFLIDAKYDPGSSIEFILTLPREITMAGDVHIRCYAEIVRVEPHNGRNGVAARIDRYEFLPATA